MENIRAKQDLLEYLCALLPYMHAFLNEMLPQVSCNWFDDCVYDALQGNQTYGNKAFSSLSDLDVYATLKVIDKNWNKMKLRNQNKFSNKALLKDVQDIRDSVAHSYERNFNSDKKLLNKFAHWLGTDLEDALVKMHEKEKERILKVIADKVLIPALNCENLDKETKESVQRTYDRLKQKTRARDIIDFFDNALEGKHGKNVHDGLMNAGLKYGFEEINELVHSVYYDDE